MKKKSLMKCIITFVLVIAMVTGAVPLPGVTMVAKAYEIDQSGKCGDNATYSITGTVGDYTLTISGTGAIADNAFCVKDMSGIKHIVLI